MQTPSIADLQARGIPFVIRENRIADSRDIAFDLQSRRVSQGMRADRAEVEKKHNEWKALFALGWTPQKIADKYGIYASTVRRVTGSQYKRDGRPSHKIRVGRQIYHSIKEAMNDLKIGGRKLAVMLRDGRAKYVR